MLLLLTLDVLTAAMSSLDPQQVAVLGNAGGVLMQADEAGQSAVTVVLRSLQDLERLVKEASSKDVRDGSVPCHISISSVRLHAFLIGTLFDDIRQCCALAASCDTGLMLQVTAQQPDAGMLFSVGCIAVAVVQHNKVVTTLLM